MSADLLAFAHELADLAGETIRPRFRDGGEVQVKDAESGRLQVVTDADRIAEERIREAICRRFPDHGVIGEEHGEERADAEHVWVIDPIDGTKAFVAGLPAFGTLVGLLENGTPLLGLIDQPVTGERIWGSPGGAFLSGEPVRTRPCAALAKAVVASTEPGMIRHPKSRAAFNALAQESLFVRYGTDCWGYAMLAAGHVDIVIEADIKSWDVLPAAAIIEAAGGRATSWSGQEPGAQGTCLAVGDPGIHAALLARFPDFDG